MFDLPEYLIYILFAVGFPLLIKGADWLVDGASSIAHRYNVSDLVIGLTIVSFGTSAPELVVNVIASFTGSADLAVGNILGSNIANILLILGIAGLIAPLGVQQNTVYKEIPLSLLAAVVLAVLANDALFNSAPGQNLTNDANLLGRGDGLILISFFVIFLYYTYGLIQADNRQAPAASDIVENIEAEANTDLPMSRAILFIGLGLLGLFFGGNFIVDGAVLISKQLGLSEALIGIAVVGVGTSLPEVAASAMAAIKGKADLAIGNVVGSNLFNIFWVLGISSMIRPIPYDVGINGDMLMTIFASVCLLVFLFARPPFRIHRFRASLFLVLYVGYLVIRITWGES
ncbi:MAG: calcium/sodium antiporter [bacterium]|nr:calcium/sodium antiporter [bacterium]